MARRGDSPTRGEIEDNVEQYEEDMSEKVDELDTYATDTETVRDTLDSLDLEMTVEGSEQVQESIEHAEDVTIEVFDREDDNLDQMVDEVREYGDELNDRQDSARDDLKKISDSSSRIETTETIDELAHTEAAVMEDMDFLDENDRKVDAMHEETQQTRDELKQRIQAGRTK